jgi:hypothetical protein
MNSGHHHSWLRMAQWYHLSKVKCPLHSKGGKHLTSRPAILNRNLVIQRLMEDQGSLCQTRNLEKIKIKTSCNRHQDSSRLSPMLNQCRRVRCKSWVIKKGRRKEFRRLKHWLIKLWSWQIINSKKKMLSRFLNLFKKSNKKLSSLSS